MSEFPATRRHRQAAKTEAARSRTFAIINDGDLSVVIVFALTGLLATLALMRYLPDWAATAALLAQMQ